MTRVHLAWLFRIFEERKILIIVDIMQRDPRNGKNRIIDRVIRVLRF